MTKTILGILIAVLSGVSAVAAAVQDMTSESE